MPARLQQLLSCNLDLHMWFTPQGAVPSASEVHIHLCAPLQPQEHENALRFFQRALQIDPTFTYAYTLAGHEYAANEDFEKGLSCYQNAVRLDPRHYNAWCAARTCPRAGQICSSTAETACFFKRY